MKKHAVKISVAFSNQNPDKPFSSSGLPSLGFDDLSRKIAEEIVAAGLADERLNFLDLTLELTVERPDFTKTSSQASEVASKVKAILDGGKAGALTIASLSARNMGISTL